ncbi:HAD family hydrolase [Bacteriovorax sp. Seq25_V]|uniref:HAD family hydrolase n=1 Tax=Bacteriovorax sp. Seq25_V TaxID=1201288 RepID=UPI000389EC11|nr:HAD family hydrolase [Bacteriovorax sp. Seq25_V]EQC43730.1 haloacid dehalogenase-like hydrolase [Bacteriovorax sp. Seq25_V]
MILENIKVIAFDADDTLWVNEPFFRSAEAKFEQILEKYLGPRDVQKALYENEVKNLHLFGYGAKGFMLAMIETALELTKYEIAGEDIQKLINMGKEILSYKIDLYDQVPETLDYLSSRFKVICITKGDLLDQESKVARSGMGDFFDSIHVVNDKKPETYSKIIDKLQVKPEEFIMIGNSLKSDILPVVEIGGRAIYIPCEQPWAHELVADDQVDKSTFIELSSMKEFLSKIKE